MGEGALQARRERLAVRTGPLVEPARDRRKRLSRVEIEERPEPGTRELTRSRRTSDTPSGTPSRPSRRRYGRLPSSDSRKVVPQGLCQGGLIARWRDRRTRKTGRSRASSNGRAGPPGRPLPAGECPHPQSGNPPSPLAKRAPRSPSRQPGVAAGNRTSVLLSHGRTWHGACTALLRSSPRRACGGRKHRGAGRKAEGMDEEVAAAQKAALWPGFWPYGARKPDTESFEIAFPCAQNVSLAKGGVENAP